MTTIMKDFRHNDRRQSKGNLYRGRVFGIPLEEACTHYLNFVPGIPFPVQHLIDYLCKEEVRKKPGIYNDPWEAPNELCYNYDHYDRFLDIPKSYESLPNLNVYSANEIGCTLMKFFLKLPEPITTFTEYHRFLEIAKTKNDSEDSQRTGLKIIIDRLPPLNRELFKMVIRHLSKIHEVKDVNKVTIEQLSDIWTYRLFRPMGIKGDQILENNEILHSVTELLITNYEFFFEQGIMFSMEKMDLEERKSYLFQGNDNLLEMKRIRFSIFLGFDTSIPFSFF